MSRRYSLAVATFQLIVAEMGSTHDFESAAKKLFTRVFGERTELESCKRLSGGASQETWALSGCGHQAILRRAPGGGQSARASAAIGLPNEAKLIEAAARNGVPVPKVLHVLTDADGMGEGFAMQRIEGETLGRPILRDEEFADARTVLAAQCGAALAAIHSIPLAGLPELSKSDGLDQIAHYEQVYRNADAPRPIFELAISWLRANAPTPRPTVLVHGDFRLGNLMVDKDGLSAVLDWELAHLGDPREDLAWVCVNSWRFGQSQNRVGGFGQLEEMLEAYAKAGGPQMTPSEIDWWEMLGSLKWGIMCMIMYEAFRSGADPSVERAAIGRRVSETEIDLVNLLEKANA